MRHKEVEAAMFAAVVDTVKVLLIQNRDRKLRSLQSMEINKIAHAAVAAFIAAREKIDNELDDPLPDLAAIMTI